MYGRITRVNTGKLNMLGYGINQDFTITGNSVHFYFFGILNMVTLILAYHPHDHEPGVAEFVTAGGEREQEVAGCGLHIARERRAGYSGPYP